jgi:Uncharacterized protein conserved in bacteria (DUF2188)
VLSPCRSNTRSGMVPPVPTAMKVVRVQPHGVNWVVELDDVPQATSPRRAEAMEAARRIAEVNRPCEMVVYGFSGEVAERWRCGPEPHRVEGPEP